MRFCEKRTGNLNFSKSTKLFSSPSEWYRVRDWSFLAIYSSFLSRICFHTLQRKLICLSIQRNPFQWNYFGVLINFGNFGKYFSGIICRSSRITANPGEPLHQKILRRVPYEMRYSSRETDQKKGFVDSKFVLTFVSQFLSTPWPRKLSDRNRRFPLHLLILFISCVFHLLHCLFLHI